MTYSEVDKLILALDGANISYKPLSLVAGFLMVGESIEAALKKAQPQLSPEVFENVKNAILPENIEKTLSKLEKYHIFALTVASADYPEQLKNIDSYPMVIYYKGDRSLLHQKSIAIVGTRKPTEYGRQATRYFAKGLAEAGLVTISGLAYGLDMEVALSTLAAKGKTIAVLGGGLDKIYPSQNTALSEQIVREGGLLVSLYPPTRRPTKYSFVDRNRIISGLSLGTIIIEAGEKSGTLNTAGHAIEQGKELFVVPSNIFSKSSLGSLKLIDEMPETFTYNIEKVLSTLHMEPAAAKEEAMPQENGKEEKQILALLFEADRDFDYLKDKTGLDSKTLVRKLTTMEISGLIKKLPSNFYTLNG